MPPLITEPFFYSVAIPAVILLGLSKGGFAGIGTAATPLVALYLPPLEAAALILPVLITQDLISLYVYRRDWDATNLKIMLPGALAGMALAWLTASYVSDDTIRIIVGLVGVAFVANMWLQRKAEAPTRGHVASGAFWGGVSGFTSFMMQGGGPPFQAARVDAGVAADKARDHVLEVAALNFLGRGQGDLRGGARRAARLAPPAGPGAATGVHGARGAGAR